MRGAVEAARCCDHHLGELWCLDMGDSTELLQGVAAVAAASSVAKATFCCTGAVLLGTAVLPE